MEKFNKFNKENLIAYSDCPENGLYEYEIFNVPGYNYFELMSLNILYPMIYLEDGRKGAHFGISQKEFNDMLKLGYHFVLICWHEEDFPEERLKELLLFKDNKFEKLIDAKGNRKNITEDNYIDAGSPFICYTEREIYSGFLPKVIEYYRNK